MISATMMTLGSDVGVDNLSKHVNVVFDNGSKMVSLSCDNSSGRLTTLSRSDIRLLFTDPLEGGVKDVTSEVFGADEHDIVHGTIENMDKAMKWLQLSSWGFGQ
jgi:hypothetical protein